MFTPPTSIVVDNRAKKSSWAQAGRQSGRHTAGDAAALHLPPLTPLPAEEPAPVAAEQVRATTASSTSSSVSRSLADAQETSGWLATSSRDTINAAAALHSHDSKCEWAHQQAGSAPFSAAATSSTLLSPSSPLPEAAAKTPPQLSETSSRVRRHHQLTRSSRQAEAVCQPCSRSASTAAQQQQAAALQGQSSAGFGDEGGPPMTRLRPAIPTSPVARNSSGSKAQSSSVNAADAILMDALLCGWEEQGDDGVGGQAENAC